MFCSNCSFKKVIGWLRFVKAFLKAHKRLTAIVSGALAVALIAAITTGIILSRPPKNYGMYLKDGQMYYTDFKSNGTFVLTEDLARNMSDSDLLSIGFQLSNRARITGNGKLLFFVDGIDENGDGSLCCRFVENDGRELMVIDTAVGGYSITKNGDKVLYLKNGTLHQFTRKGLKREVIAENVCDVRMSNDGKKAVIIGENGSCKVYYVSGKSEQIAETVEELLYISDDFKTVYFKAENKAYKWIKGKGVKPFADNVHAIVAAYDSGKLYFVRANYSEVLAEDYINDDVKYSDLEMKKPAYPLPPAKKDYKTTEAWKADYDIYLGEMDRYYQLMQEYYAKQDRDKVRQQLDGYKITLVSYTLYYYDGKKETKLSENYNFEEFCRDHNTRKPALVYSVYVNDTKAKLSDISCLEDVEAAILGCLHSYPKTQLAIGEKVQSLSFGVQSADFRFTPDGKMLYYIDNVDNKDGTGNIYTVKVGRTAGKRKLYDSDVDVEQGLALYENGSVAYCKKSSKQGFKLFIDGDSVSAVSSMDYVNYNKYSKAFAFYTDHDGDSQGTLKVYKNGKVTVVNENIHRYSFTPNGEILYLKNYDMEVLKGDLYLFDGKKSRLVDTAVTEIIDAYSYGERNEWYY